MAKSNRSAKVAKKLVPKSTDAIVSAAELARLLDLSAKTVAHLAMRGDVVRTSRGAYRREASIVGYIRSLRAAASGRSSPTTEAKAELLRLQVSAAARKDALEAGELVRAADVTAWWSDICTRFRNRMLSVPMRAGAHLPQLGPADIALIDREIREALTEISEPAPPAEKGAHG